MSEDPLSGTGYADEEKEFIIDLCKPRTKPQRIIMLGGKSISEYIDRILLNPKRINNGKESNHIGTEE